MAQEPPSTDVATHAIHSGPTEPGKVDVDHLAERVYRLMLADLRLAFARGEQPSGRSRRTD